MPTAGLQVRAPSVHPYTRAQQQASRKLAQRRIGSILPTPTTTTGSVGEGVGVGAVLGAIAGALVGVATGGVGAGAGYGAAAGAVGGGIYGYVKRPTTATATPGAGTTGVTLAAGAMPAQSLSVSTLPNLQIMAPDATSTIQSTTSSNTAVIASGGAGAGSPQSTQVAALTAGTTTLTVAWTDSTGAAQTSTIAVTVTA